MKRRAISLLLAVALFLTFLPTFELSANAEEDWRAWSKHDSRWGSLPLGSSSKTVASDGCLVTSVTKLIIQSGLRDASGFNVGTLVNWLNNNNGFQGAGLIWAKPSQCVSGFKYYGQLLSKGSYSSSDYNSKIISWIKAGYHMAICVNGGGHWVAVDEAKSLATGQVYIMNSNEKGPNVDVKLVDEYSTFTRIHAYTGGSTPTASDVPTNPSVDASNIVFPDTLTVGQDCSPNGHIVSSNTVMTWIWIGIFDQSGARITEASENINTTSYDISKLAGQLNYSILQEGTYTVEIDVVCGNDYYVPFCKTFTVRSAEKYYLDLNGFLDGINTDGIDGYGCVDIYINGSVYNTNCPDFYEYFPYGTTYEIKNIQVVPGHSYMGVYSGSLSGIITGNTIVELKFGTNSTVYFDANGGNTPTSSKAVICGETYGVLPVPTRANYTFDGWYTEKDGGLIVTEITTVTTRSEHTLYAHWTADCSAGHNYTAKIVAPTCTAQGYTVHTCTRCGDCYNDSYVDALGHAWDEGTVTKWPTEYEEGELTYTCTRCSATKTESIPKSAHIHCYSITETVEATCTEYGYTVGICESCGSRTAEYDIVEPLDHDWDTGTVIIYPTETEPGKKIYTCRRCGEYLVNIMPPYGNHEYGYCPTEMFTDAPGWTDWAHAGVDFVVDHGLFNGTSETTFSPNSSMTRAMLVTVLWRYAGEPTEGENIFTDVGSDTYYTKAVAWAACNEIVGGVGNGKFDPNGNITREQMAAILYRYATKLGIDTSKCADLTSFPDANKVSSWASEALSWANAEGLITGSKIGNNNYLDPQGNATRAQVATILMRFIENVLG